MTTILLPRDPHPRLAMAKMATAPPLPLREALRQTSLKWGTWEPGSQALWMLAGTFSETTQKIASLNRPVEYRKALLIGNLSNVPVEHIKSAWQSATDTKRYLHVPASKEYVRYRPHSG